MYQARTYRNWIHDRNLASYSIIIKETDLYIRTSSDLRDKAFNSASKFRNQIENYIQLFPDFAKSFKPVFVGNGSPQIIKDMAEAAELFNVGPMAAIAGAIAESVGKELLESSEEVIIENGGDIFVSSKKNRTIAIYAGSSPLNGKYGIDISAEDTPLGICTSSGTVGHSFSFGKADAVVIVAGSTLIADAAATAICNMVKNKSDISKALNYAKNTSMLKGAVIVKDKDMGVWGELRLCEISRCE